MINLETIEKIVLIWALLASVLMVFAAAAIPSNAQQVGPAFTFSDKSLQKSDLDIFQIMNGSMVYVTTINSSSGKIIYDPTSDYVIAFHPTIMNTYGASANGIVDFLVNNPELDAIIVAAVIILVLIAIIFILIFYRRR